MVLGVGLWVLGLGVCLQRITFLRGERARVSVRNVGVRIRVRARVEG
jgi:hypothetical protein